MSRITSDPNLASAPLTLVVTSAFTGQGNSHNYGSSSTPTSTTASSSSPYSMTPSSNPDHSHPYGHSNARRSPLNAHALHPPPSMPSTFLPSYYSESRFPSDSLPSSLAVASAHDGSEQGNHTPLIWERASRTGPSPLDLLEGVHLPSPYLDAKQNGFGSGFIGQGGGGDSGSGRDPQIEASTNQRSLAGIPALSLSSISSTSQIHWQTANGKGNGHETSRQSSIGPQAATHGQSSPIFPIGPVSGTPSGSGGSRITGGDYSLPSFMLPPPQPSLSQLATIPNTHPEAHTIRPSASYVDGDTGPLPDFIESSSVYPPGMYGTHLLMDTVSSPGESTDGRLEPGDMNQIYTIYSDLLQGLSHIVPNNQAAPIPTSSSGPTLTSLLSLSTEGTNLLKGQKQHSANSEKKNSASARSLAHRLPATKCLGCGATETPEWRRGPLGPRTLCNACGLVHIKLQRKKKKQEEKARAAAAAAGEAKPNGDSTSSQDRKM